MIAKINENIEMVLGDIFFFAKKPAHYLEQPGHQ